MVVPQTGRIVATHSWAKEQIFYENVSYFWLYVYNIAFQSRLSLSLRSIFHQQFIWMRTLFRYMSLPLLVGLLIFIGTCLIGPGSVPNMPKGFPWDKVAHFVLFFLLSAVSLYDYDKLHHGSPSRLRWIFWGFILPVFYGGFIELLQFYIFTTRSAEKGDLIADVAGSLTALLLAIICIRKRKKSIKNISL